MSAWASNLFAGWHWQSQFRMYSELSISRIASSGILSSLCWALRYGIWLWYWLRWSVGSRNYFQDRLNMVRTMFDHGYLYKWQWSNIEQAEVRSRRSTSLWRHFSVTVTANLATVYYSDVGVLLGLFFPALSRRRPHWIKLFTCYRLYIILPLDTGKIRVVTRQLQYCNHDKLPVLG